MENKNYEWVELPSKGQCYPTNSPLKGGKVKVSYLTAMDGQLSNALNGGRGSLPIGIGNVLNPSELLHCLSDKYREADILLEVHSASSFR